MADLLRQKYVQFFRMTDRDHNGRITREDYIIWADMLVDALGLEAGSTLAGQIRNGLLNMWDSLAKSADKNDDGSVDVEEWVAHWKAVATNDEALGTHIKSVIDIFDRDRDGKVTLEDWRLYFQGSGLCDHEHETAFEKLDLDGDGYLDNDELYEVTRQFFLSNDPGSRGNWLFGNPTSSE